MKRVFATVLSGAIAALTFIAPGSIGTASAAGACTNVGSFRFTITSHATSQVVTHLKTVFVAPGSSYSSTQSATKIATVSAGLNGSLTISDEVNLGIASLGSSLSIGLNVAGSLTKQTSETVQFNIAAPTTPKTYVVFAGVTKVSGTYNEDVCARVGNGYAWTTKKTNGTVQSWYQTSEGTALCGASYAVGSLPRLALQKSGNCPGA